MATDERVARLIQAARDLVDAYHRKATANEHFQALEQAVEALGDTDRPRPAPPEKGPPVAGLPDERPPAR
ncbi:MAG TPA: hypothetical protein VF880_13685 [Actinomycetes bacterium]|jgi:hypothetical protein